MSIEYTTGGKIDITIFYSIICFQYQVRLGRYEQLGCSLSLVLEENITFPNVREEE